MHWVLLLNEFFIRFSCQHFLMLFCIIGKKRHRWEPIMISIIFENTPHWRLDGVECTANDYWLESINKCQLKSNRVVTDLFKHGITNDYRWNSFSVRRYYVWKCLKRNFLCSFIYVRRTDEIDSLPQTKCKYYEPICHLVPKFRRISHHYWHLFIHSYDFEKFPIE